MCENKSQVLAGIFPEQIVVKTENFLVFDIGHTLCTVVDLDLPKTRMKSVLRDTTQKTCSYRKHTHNTGLCKYDVNIISTYIVPLRLLYLKLCVLCFECVCVCVCVCVHEWRQKKHVQTY